MGSDDRDDIKTICLGVGSGADGVLSYRSVRDIDLDEWHVVVLGFE